MYCLSLFFGPTEMTNTCNVYETKLFDPMRLVINLFTLIFANFNNLDETIALLALLPRW